MSEWISVDESMPNEGQEIFASGLDGGEGPGRHYARCQFHKNVFYEMCGDCKTDDVLDYITHWMPLPEPPKE